MNSSVENKEELHARRARDNYWMALRTVWREEVEKEKDRYRRWKTGHELSRTVS